MLSSLETKDREIASLQAVSIKHDCVDQQRRLILTLCSGVTPV